MKKANFFRKKHKKKNVWKEIKNIRLFQPSLGKEELSQSKKFLKSLGLVMESRFKCLKKNGVNVLN